MYLPTASGGSEGGGSAGSFDVYRRATASGHPALVYAGSAPGAFGFGSSPPTVTSDDTTTGSAVVWIVYTPNGSGAGAELRAYDAIPQDGALPLLNSWPIGTATKFAPPGVGRRKVYVGTRDGHVLGFGAPATAPLTAGPGTFPTTTVGTTSSRSVVFRAERTVTVESLALTGDGAFTTGAPSPALPATLRTGEELTVPASFAPATPGVKGASITATTGDGPASASLSGTAQARDPLLTVDVPVIDFAGVTVGNEQRRTVTFGNAGGRPLHVASVQTPGAPFSVEGIAAGMTIEPGASVTAIVHFAPTATGDFAGDLRVDSDTSVPPGKDPADMGLVGVSGAGATPPELVTEPAAVDFGVVAPGTSTLRTVTLRNAGGSVLTIYKSKPPSGGPFSAVDALDEGTTFQAGQERSLRVRFAPDRPGSYTQAWGITADDATGARSLSFSGVAPLPPVATGGGPPTAALPAAAAGRTPRVTGLRLSARLFRTRAHLRIRARDTTRVRVRLERRGTTGWVRRAGARDVALVGGTRTVTLSARGLRAGRWRVVVAPIPGGTVRRAEFRIAR